MAKKEFTLNRFLPLIHIFTVFITVLLAFKIGVFFLPFVLALGVVTLTRPISNYLQHKLKWSKKLSNGIVITSFYLIISAIIVVLLIVSFSELYSFINWLIANIGNSKDYITDILNQFDGFKIILPEFVQLSLKNGLNYLVTKMTGFSISFLNYLLSLTLNLPILLVYLIITITATYLMANDTEAVYDFFDKQFPKSWINKFDLIRIDVFSVAYKYFKSQLILVLLCFVELFIGFSVINLILGKINYVLMLAILIALVDALPILGTGSVLIPWSIYLIATSQIGMGMAIIILYLIVWVLRAIMEPKVLSANLSINPLISLISLFVGFKLFGVLGFLYGPIIFTVMTIVFEDEIKNGFFKILSGEVNENEV